MKENNNPILIKCKKNDAYICINGEIIPIINTITFNEKHYGFYILKDDYERVLEEYKTEDSISKVQIENGQIAIYEENKKTPWIISFDRNITNNKIKKMV